jgi:hypothetical protein
VSQEDNANGHVRSFRETFTPRLVEVPAHLMLYAKHYARDSMLVIPEAQGSGDRFLQAEP